MIKIPTLFKKNPNNLALVTNEIDPQNQWVVDGEGNATRKFDGTAAAVIDGRLYKRYDVKKGRQVPYGAIPCQEPDAITGNWPHWIKCEIDSPEDRYFLEAESGCIFPDGTYELCGPKVNGNREKLDRHVLIKHGDEVLNPGRTWAGIKSYLIEHDIEGIVFHHPDGRMCKIRKSDYGIKR